MVECFEKHFGHARVQKVTSDAALQQEDNSQKPTPLDAKNFRSRIGLLLYLARDRVDVMYCMGQRACVSCQLCLRRLLCSVQRLRKLIGFVKYMGDIASNCNFPNMVLESSSKERKRFGF